MQLNEAEVESKGRRIEEYCIPTLIKHISPLYLLNFVSRFRVEQDYSYCNNNNNNKNDVIIIIHN